MRYLIAGITLLAWLVPACGHSGFVQLSQPAPAQSPASQLPIHVARDIGRPYQVLGYVFRSTQGHKSGLEAMDESMYLLSYSSEEMNELRRQALARGADAVVGLEMFPTLGVLGHPVGFSVGGLAVKFTGSATDAPASDSAPATDSSTSSWNETSLPDVSEKTAPDETPEPADGSEVSERSPQSP